MTRGKAVRFPPCNVEVFVEVRIAGHCCRDAPASISFAAILDPAGLARVSHRNAENAVEATGATYIDTSTWMPDDNCLMIPSKGRG